LFITPLGVIVSRCVLLVIKQLVSVDSECSFARGGFDQVEPWAFPSGFSSGFSNGFFLQKMSSLRGAPMR